MMRNNIKRTIRFIAVLLALIIVFPVNTLAAEPKASLYLSSYNVGIAAIGNGKVEIAFDVIATDYMDKIGAMSIYVYEAPDGISWEHVKTYYCETYTNMTAVNRMNYLSTVTYSGTAGKYYKAYVTIWAGKNGGGDTRYAWTAIRQAT